MVKPSAAAAVLQSPFVTVCPFQLLQLLKELIAAVGENGPLSITARKYLHFGQPATPCRLHIIDIYGVKSSKPWNMCIATHSL